MGEVMPYYKITILLNADASNPAPLSLEVFRQYKVSDIEVVWHKLENKCRIKWAKRLDAFDCVMFSKRSMDYQRYLKQLKQRPGGIGALPAKGVIRTMEAKSGRGPGKYRS